MKSIFVIVYIYTSQTIIWCFLFRQELKLLGARVVENSGILDLLIKLLEVVQPCLQAAKEQKDIQTPKWVLQSPSYLSSLAKFTPAFYDEMIHVTVVVLLLLLLLFLC